ncbi:MAG: dihydrolipoamide acetyltransferase family protein, partial [Acholeplasmataceae bacterium]|nr:dihydrolipoamide acetyltransferase family protein [Acholeplasmataceae bacterium]
IIKAVVLALKEYPVFNSSFDHETEEIVYKEFYNIGIAVDTEVGLIVPNIKNADRKSILELAKEIDELAQDARDRKIQLNQLQNTTFSITNYGAFGSKLGTPVIKHPEVAILGMGAITKQPAVIDDQIVIRDMFPVSLTIDHRVIDGGDAGRFLVKLRELLSDPIKLLLS